MKNLWMSWSTGKDSAYALYQLRNHVDIKVTGLFTTVTESYERVSMHSTRESLLYKQAEALGLPLEIIQVPAKCTNETYELQMMALLKKASDRGVTAMGFGDLHLQDVRSYREKLLRDTDIEPVFPLWNQPTASLAKEMILDGIKAILTCVDPTKLDSSFAGRIFDASLLEDFPPDIDPCGENGEFHTFVFSSPSFQGAIPFSVGEIVKRDGFVFADVLPVD